MRIGIGYWLETMRKRSVLLVLLGLLLLIASYVGIQLWSAVGKQATGDRLERMRRSSQYAVSGFVNPLHVRPGNMDDFMREYFFGDKALRSPGEPLPRAERNTSDYSTTPGDLRITWLGHSTLLVEIGGKRFLTDPMWGKRASPLSFIGPARFHDPALGIDELPPLDAVVLSHDHYDHLDEGSIKKLRDIVPLFVAPLGLGAHLAEWGVPESKIVEMDWWEEFQLEDVRLVCTPARHFSGRFLRDQNATLWAGWAFLGEKERAFFSGDSGLFPGFAEIGNRLGPFDVTMLDTGAYNMAWPDVHMGPEQATQAHQMLRGKVLLPVHWGTFDLSIHGWTAPVERLLAAADQAGILVVTPRPGERVVPSDPDPVNRWWPKQLYRTAEEFPIVSSQLEPQGSGLKAP
jgi:L-ascorbate metabolism protein UlaG (beta-lactamase superfamily)